MKSLWLRLGSKYQRWVVIGVVIIAGGFLVSSFSSDPPVMNRDASGKQKNSRYIFTDRTVQETGIDHLAATVKSLSRQNEQLQEALSRLHSSLDNKGKEIAAQEAKVDAKVQLIEQRIENIFEKAHSPQTARQQFNQTVPHSKNFLSAGEASNAGQPVSMEQLKIITYSANKPKEEAKEVNKKPKKLISSLPAGSVLRGILLNGMDAPTTQSARREPVPSLVRLQSDAILPNLARSDVKECFLLLSGYGDLSAARAYLRGETISCICEDGSSIEEPLDGYAVGEDGKVGVRGRVVSKQERAVANSMMAGFLGGAASAFDVNPVPSVNLNGSNKTVFQSTLSQDVFQGAAVKGAGQAMDRVAKFYLEMAENLFPVIEVDAGRQIEVIVKKGSNF